MRAITRFRAEIASKIDDPDPTAQPTADLVPEDTDGDDSEIRRLDGTDVPVGEALRDETDESDSDPDRPSGAGPDPSAFEDPIQVKEAIRPLRPDENDADKEGDDSRTSDDDSG